jgi:large repetitive protein
VVVEQGVAMWAGNALQDNATQTLTSPPYNNVIYQGTQNDVEAIYQQVINPPGFLVTPYTIRSGYMNGDINLDGQTLFQGTRNDVEFIYQNVIKNHPGNTLVVPFFIIKEQLP